MPAEAQTDKIRTLRRPLSLVFLSNNKSNNMD